MNPFRAVMNFLRRSLENPSTPLSAGADWLYDAFGAARAGSGMRVSRETSLTYPAVWRAVSLIGRDVAKLPVAVQRWLKPGWETDVDHAAHWLIACKPNSEMTPFIFWQTLMYHVLLMGNGYAYIYRNPDGSPNELVILLPDMTYPVRENGQLYYVAQIGQNFRKLLPENVLHLKGLGYDGLAGYSVISKARESIGLGLGQNRYASIFFRNNAQPSIVLKHPGSLSDTAHKHIKESWTAMQGGLDNAHKPKILEEAMEVEQISINARDAQLIESRSFEIREIANWFNVPPHKLGDNSRLAYNSLEQENQAYLDDALDPWLRMIEDECWEKLLTEKQKRKGTHRIEFNRRKLIHANLEARADYWTKFVNGGLATPGMAAEEEGWNPPPPEVANQWRIPAGVQILDEEGMPMIPQPPQPNPPEQGDAPKGPDIDDSPNKPQVIRAHRELLRATAQRLLRRIGREARDVAKKPGRFHNWLDKVPENCRQDIAEGFAPVIDSIRVVHGHGPEWGAGLPDILISRACESLLDVSGRLTTDEFEAGIGAFLDDFEQKEPETVTNLLIFEEKRTEISANLKVDGISSAHVTTTAA